MEKEIFMQIVGAVFTLIMSLITAYLVPWIKTKMDANQLAQINKYIELAVRCAEQIFTPEQWREKKDYVYDYIINKVETEFKIHLTEADIDLMIEGVVNEVKRG